MFPISSISRSIQIYADAAALGIHTSNNHGLFEDDELFEENLVDDGHEQVSIRRGGSREPIAHMPVSRLWTVDLNPTNQSR